MISSTTKTAFLIIALAAITSLIVGSTLAQTQLVRALNQSSSGQIARSIETFQNATHIIITITKPNGKPEPIPPGPIIVIPPNETTTKGNVTESGNQTQPSENQTVTQPSTPGAGNITTIEPGQNITVVPLPPGNNVTTVDNGTVVIIHPPDRNITQTPANVTVIDPAPPAPCTCMKNSTVTKTNETTSVTTPGGTNETKSNQTTTVTPPANANNTEKPMQNATNANATKPIVNGTNPPLTPGLPEGNSSGGLSTSAMKALKGK